MSSGLPFSEWTPGAPLADFREIRYGSFVFPLTGQEKTRDLKTGQDRKKIPGGWGEWIGDPSSVAGREIELIAAVGSNMIGSQGNTILTQDDLEAERALLAGLQALGRQQLYLRPDRYIQAYLTEFQFAFMQDAGAFRFSDWSVKFVADDPRYFATDATTQTIGPITDTTPQTFTISQNGNVRAYPTITISDACTSPSIQIQQGLGGLMKLTFSQLTMVTGDQLIINCDPRPENRDQAVTYLPAAGGSVNGLQYCLITDFVNSLNVEEWFPYIEVTTIAPTQNFTVQSTATGNYTCTVVWRDTWL